MPRNHLPPASLFWCCVALGAAALARAHDPFEITATAHLRRTTLEVDLTMARSTALAIATGNAEAPTFAPAEFARHHDEFVAAAPRLYLITAGGRTLEMQTAEVSLGRENDVDFHLVYPAPAPGAGGIRFEALHVAQLAYGYGDSLVVRDEAGNPLGTALLGRDTPALEIRLLAAPQVIEAPRASPGPASATAAPSPSPPGNLFLPFFRLGVGHILTGYDHLLFLLGLLVACRSGRRMFAIVTCFTLAHSITLSLAAFGVVAIPGRIVEPLIAASIVFVGVENLLRRGEPPRRWLLTLLFGLIHGFGFAGALREAGLGLRGAALGVPLFSFNLGVELGQLGVVAVVFPLLLWLRGRPGFVRFGPPVLSAIIALAGAWWFLQRTVFA